MPARPYTPASVPLVGVQLHNLLSTRARTFTHESTLGTCAWSLHPQAAPFPCAARMRVRLGPSSWIVGISSTEFLLLHPAMPADPALDERMLPAEVRRALLEVCAAPLAEALGALLGAPASLAEADFPTDRHDFTPALSCSVAIAPRGLPQADIQAAAYGPADAPAPDTQGAASESASAESTAPSPAERRTVRLTVGIIPESADAVPELLRMAAALPRASAGFLDPARLASIPLEASLCAGTRALSPEDASALGPGDIIIPQEWLPSRGQALVIIRSGAEAGLQGLCSLSDGRAVINSPLSQEIPMENASDVEVTLTFELGSRRIPFGDLGSLAPGYVFDLPESPEAPVTVRANGRPIAKGRLVDLGGTLGVQLLEAVK